MLEDGKQMKRRREKGNPRWQWGKPRSRPICPIKPQMCSGIEAHQIPLKVGAYLGCKQVCIRKIRFLSFFFNIGRTPEVYSPERLDVEKAASAEDKDASPEQENKVIIYIRTERPPISSSLTQFQKYWQHDTTSPPFHCKTLEAFSLGDLIFGYSLKSPGNSLYWDQLKKTNTLHTEFQ